MANKQEYVRRVVPIEQTPSNAGLMINLQIGDYDNDIITVNGEPMGGMGGDNRDRAQAVAGMMRFVGQAIEELLNQSRKRKQAVAS
jgi:hypothetical protein